MSDHNREFDSDADRTPIRPGQLSSNGHWVFGSIYALLTLVGFGFGVWAGAAKPKSVESAEAKPKEPGEKVVQKPAASPPVVPSPQPAPPIPDPPKPEPVKPEPVKPEPPKPEPPKPDLVKPVPPKTEPPKPPAKVVALKEVAPLFRTYCGNCHGMAGKPKGGVDLRTLASMMKGGANGDILKAGDPMNSKLYTSMLPGASEPMPPDGKPGPSEKEIMLIRDWIAGGARERRTIRRRGGRGGARHKLELTAPAGAG